MDTMRRNRDLVGMATVCRRASSGMIGLLLLVLLSGTPVSAQFTITEINPDRSTLDPSDPDGASGGRVNHLASVRGTNRIFFAASEWGGLYKSTDAGHTWLRMNRHLPTAMWDVKVDPRDTRRVYATSFYDGRVSSLAGINVSTDAGDHWTHPPTATPPGGLCSSTRRNEPSAYGIGIDPDNPKNVYIGTNCGVAISNDSGVTWRFVDPTPKDPALNTWGVVVHHQGIVDICGDDGHLRSIDGGATWIAGTDLPSGICSIAASPFEKDVLFVTVGANIFESDDGGSTWTNLGTPDSRRQGRIPFVATNQRTGKTFDLWYGDVHLYRGSCLVQEAGLRCPAAATGAPLAAPPAGWSGPFTRSTGGHDDAGDIAFDATLAVNACPVLFSSDGGVYFNTRKPTLDTKVDCQTPFWEQPDITPHGLWAFGMDGAHEPGAANEDLYFGNQDNGTFATTNAGAASPTWNNGNCCDSFDFAADPVRVAFTVCCGFGIYTGTPGIPVAIPIATNPPGCCPAFNFPDFIYRFGDNQYVAATASGAFITTNITANPVVWTQLGAASSPHGGFCAVKSAVSGGTPTFYAQTSCLGGQLWKYTGTAPGNTWQEVDTNSGLTGGFGIYAVDVANPDRLYAANLSPGGPQMVFSTNGGNTWNNDPGLDAMMTGSGAFKYQTQRGPTNFTGFLGYPQPSLVAFDPADARIVVAGGIDSGVFVSTDMGATWTLATDPLNSGDSGTPHIPRPWFAYFNHDSPGSETIYVGTQGRGVWRVSFRPPPEPRFEYATKIVCGVQKDPSDLRLTRGSYATTINVHNPNEAPATFFKKLALSFPPGGQRAGEVLPIATDKLGPDEALAVDCADIARRFRNGFPAPYIEGFVVIQSELSLDVTAVYTTASLDQGGAVTAQSGIEVDHVRERRLAESLPDLVPLSDASGSFCRRTQDRTQSKLIVTVKNQGGGPAGASTTEVTFSVFSKIDLATPALDPGEFVDLFVDIPPDCRALLGSRSCLSKIVVDVKQQVAESNEANNVATVSCTAP